MIDQNEEAKKFQAWGVPDRRARQASQARFVKSPRVPAKTQSQHRGTN
jgi:hypothetical protein